MLTSGPCRLSTDALAAGERKANASAAARSFWLAGVAVDTVTRLQRGEELKPRTVDAISAAL